MYGIRVPGKGPLPPWCLYKVLKLSGYAQLKILSHSHDIYSSLNTPMLMFIGINVPAPSTITLTADSNPER